MSTDVVAADRWERPQPSWRRPSRCGAWKLPPSAFIDTGAPARACHVGILTGAVMLRTLVGGAQR
ncbi:MAG TPA: hypothetical protein VFO49_07635 [Nocardioides sp.]|nr:hypothetical protein [Nocardioides sp.]